jgi:hypothetical protein
MTKKLRHLIKHEKNAWFVKICMGNSAIGMGFFAFPRAFPFISIKISAWIAKAARFLLDFVAFSTIFHLQQA